MIDLILWAPDGQTLVRFARSRGLIVRGTPVIDRDPESPTFGEVLEQGEWEPRRGFMYSAWGGSGQFLTSNKQLRTSLDVEVIQEGVAPVPAQFDEEGNETSPAVAGVPAEFGFRVGPTLPAWVDETTMAYDGQTFKGRFLRKQGPFAVFSSTGAATVGQTLDIYTPEAVYLPGLVYLVRMMDKAAEDDAEIDEAEEKQARKSKLVRHIRRNGTVGRMGVLDYGELDGVRIFLPEQVDQWIAARGLPTHGHGGGAMY